MEWGPGGTWLVVRILVKGTSHDSSHPFPSLKIVSSFTSKEEVREFQSDVFFFFSSWGKRPFSNPFLSMAGIILQRDAGRFWGGEVPAFEASQPANTNACNLKF